MKRISLVSLAVALLATPVGAQERSLHWSDLKVDATLDADGTLRVVERQTIVFSGEWNGGERWFYMRPRQRLQFDGMERIDSAGGRHEMHRGSLDVVDGFNFTDSRTLRWRSRLPSDPAFDNTAITYELAYSLSNILQVEGDDWVLDHNFAIVNRDGIIQHIAVTLKLDPAWQATGPFAGSWQATNLPPGEDFLVHVPLRYAAAGDAPAVPGADPAERAILAVVALMLLGSIGRRLYGRERETGRLDPLPSPEVVNEKWLEEHVFSQLPEVVGAAWDNTTGESEVAAVLARLVADGRMRSEVKPGGTFKDPVLHLELLVDRSRFHGYEQRLIDALFQRDETTTDTARIREHYKQSGFDPAEKIKKPLTELVKGLVPDAKRSRPPALPSLLSFLFAIALLVTAVAREPADAPVAFIGAAVMVVCYLIALGGATVWRNRVHDVGRAAGFFLVPMGVSLVMLLAFLATGVAQASALALAGLTVMYLAFANSIFNQARTRESQERIALRRRLAVGRSYFINELDRDTPRLKDAWFPYLIAFGLGKHMDKWFAAFGGESEPSLATVSHSSGSSGHSSSSNSGGGWSGFGGGGGFSGGGSSASWAAAAGSIAAGVSAPSSSSGGSSGGGSGGGGGGGSSGGGGGGGW